MTPRVSDIIEIIDKIAPFRYAEEWDNVGLQVGDPTSPAAKIMVSLDAGSEAIDDAIAGQYQLLLTHHPLIFQPLKKIAFLDPSGGLIARAIQNNLNIVSLHTNFDSAVGGISDMLAKRLGVNFAIPLVRTKANALFKLVVFVPKGHEERVVEALFRYTGFIGNYSDCSFQLQGTGTFRPLSSANPFIGTIGTREYVDETRIEVLLREIDMKEAVDAMLSVHPYEEPAFDVYPLRNEGSGVGLGMVGDLDNTVSLEQFALMIKKAFALEGVRIVGQKGQEIKRVALCGGSGVSLAREAFRQGADVLVTGDVKYHDAREAQAQGLALIDMGHFASEFLMVNGFVGLLEKELVARGLVAEIVGCTSERDPFHWM